VYAAPNARVRAATPVVVVVAAALVVNLVRVGHPALWRDEVATVVAAQRSPLAILQLLKHDDAPFGAYYLIMHFWLEVSARASWVRLPSALAAATAAGFVFLLGSRLAGTGVGVASSAILVALPFDTRYAQEARPYALVMCGATVASWLLISALQEGRRPNWIGYAVILAVTVALHVFAVGLVLAHLATCTTVYRRKLGRYLPWALASIPALTIASVIALLTVGDSTSHAWIPPVQPSTPYYALLDFTGSSWGIAATLVLVAAGALVGGRQLIAITVPWLVVPGALLIAASLVQPVFVSRYLLYSLPALSLLAGAGVVGIARIAGLPTRPTTVRFVAAAVGGALLVAIVYRPQVELRRLDAHGDDPRAEAAYLVSVAQPGDGIVYAPRDLAHSLVPYATTNQLPTDALLAETATASSTLNGVQVTAAQAAGALLRFRRLWVLDIPGLEDNTLLAVQTRSILAASYREVSASYQHGVDVLLYERRSAPT
jgi:mannosyltransferase